MLEGIAVMTWGCLAVRARGDTVAIGGVDVGLAGGRLAGLGGCLCPLHRLLLLVDRA